MRSDRWLSFMTVVLTLCAAIGVSIPLPSGSVAHAQPADMPCRWSEPEDRWITGTCSQDDFGFARVRVFRTEGPWPAGARPDPNVGETYWLFMRLNRAEPSLIVHFHQLATGAIADLHDDADGDTEVSFAQQPTSLRVTEAGGHWTIRVTAPGGWWERNGMVNFNLDIEVAGPVQGMLDTVLYQHLLARNGSVNLYVHVRDTNHNGRPEYEWRQAHPPLDETDGYYHSSIMVNTRDDEPAQSGTTPFWPHLGQQKTELVKPYFQSPAPIQIEWDAGRLRVLSEFVASRGRAGNYFVYSIDRIERGETSFINFESPFAFYRLGDGALGYPDLALRVARFNPGDRRLAPADGPLVRPMQQIDYSWRLKDEERLASRSGFDHDTGESDRRWDRPEINGSAPVWDYKVSVAGEYAMDEIVQFPELGLRMIPFDQLPTWVTTRTWSYATFVARESEGYPSNEGLYELYPLEGDEPGAARYLAGIGWTAPDDRIVPMQPGWRGEMSFDYQQQPWLYLSPVDRKLHLLGAKHGYWKIDEHRVVRYRDLDGDGHIDLWTIEADGVLKSSLLVRDGQALLTERGTVRLKALSQTDAELFRALPPDQPETWRSLRDQLDAHGAAPGGTIEGLDEMYKRLSGEEISLVAATASDLRVVVGTTSFILALFPGWEIHGDVARHGWVEYLRLGQHIVHISKTGEYTVLPYRPAALHGDPVNVIGDEPVANRSVVLSTTVRNVGSEDVAEVPVVFMARSERGTEIEMGRRSVDVLREDVARVTIQWVPPHAGRWEVRVVVAEVPTEPVELLVRAALSPEVWTVLGMQRPGLVVIVAAVLSLLGAVAVAAWLGIGLWPAGGGQGVSSRRETTMRSASGDRSL